MKYNYTVLAVGGMYVCHLFYFVCSSIHYRGFHFDGVLFFVSLFDFCVAASILSE